jgi:eukaryotic-like serine/threonine-protein kinase
VRAGNGVLTALTSRDPPRIGPYKLLGVLGAGGFGRVFLGESADGQLAAVKVIHAQRAADRDFRERFRREAAAAKSVRNRFTARLIDADVDGPEPWLATEYVDGPSLAEAVALDGPLPADSVLVLAAGLAEALAAIHAASLVHRDLKPENVLLAEDGPRVIDFGIARADGASRLTSTDVVIGTFAFMSPEQALGRAVGPPSDVFSLGSVLVFAATGQEPFGAGANAELLYRIAYKMPDLDQVPTEVRPLAVRCLARDPARRPVPGDLLAYLSHVHPEGLATRADGHAVPLLPTLGALAQPAVGQGNSPQPAPRQPMASGSASSEQSVLTLVYAARSDVGLVRELNEDSAYAGPMQDLTCSR